MKRLRLQIGKMVMQGIEDAVEDVAARLPTSFAAGAGAIQ